MNGKISAGDLSQKVVLAFPFERRKFLSGAGQSLVVSSAVLPRQIEMIAAKAHRLTSSGKQKVVGSERLLATKMVELCYLTLSLPKPPTQRAIHSGRYLGTVISLLVYW